MNANLAERWKVKKPDEIRPVKRLFKGYLRVKVIIQDFDIGEAVVSPGAYRKWQGGGVVSINENQFCDD